MIDIHGALPSPLATVGEEAAQGGQGSEEGRGRAGAGCGGRGRFSSGQGRLDGGRAWLGPRLGSEEGRVGPKPDAAAVGVVLAAGARLGARASGAGTARSSAAGMAQRRGQGGRGAAMAGARRGSTVGAVRAGPCSVVGGSAVGKNGPIGEAKNHLKPLVRVPTIRHSAKVLFF
jgi:hypothetical protein